MGRGRQKAKQTKVARALKYDTGSTDLSALQAELAGARGSLPSGAGVGEDIPEGDYSAWIEDDEEEGEELADDATDANPEKDQD